MLLFILGLITGANISLFLYACVLAGKTEDNEIFMEGEDDEWGKSN